MIQVQLATVTQKGQVTIPIDIRNLLGIKAYSKIAFTTSNKTVTIQPTEDVLDLAGFIKAPKGVNAIKAREYMQAHYK